VDVPEQLPRVVIVGGGFGGLAAARALRRAPVDVILIDRNNHNLFQPMLYQVATAVLAPGQVGSPLRGILGKQKNTTVIMGEVTGVNKEERYIVASSADRTEVPIPYDYLVLATGVSHSYFGHDEFAPFAPGLKSLADAVAVRNRILKAFEQAEAEEDPSRHRDLLTFILVGAGPTGVEMAGALAVPDIVKQPQGNGWLDFWVICDDTKCYLFNTDDHGRLLRSETGIKQFPNGFHNTVAVMTEKREDLFEASNTYRIANTHTYITLVEAISPQGRYFRIWKSDSVDGKWEQFASAPMNTFASRDNVDREQPIASIMGTSTEWPNAE